MARPLRIEFPDAVYHVTSRGDRQEPIFLDDTDRAVFVDLLAQALTRHDAGVLAYCLMGNHYHLVLQTRRPNLSTLMRHINGVFTLRMNRRHGTVGHIFQGRYKAILVDRDAYLLEVCRYVDLNPVRAGLVASPQDWPWSSYRALAGAGRTPDWLDTDTLYGALMGGRAPASPAEHELAARRYAELVATARDVPLWAGALRQQVYLGDDAFVQRMQSHAPAKRLSAPEVPRPQRTPPARPAPLSTWLTSYPTREEALYRAYSEGGLTMTAMARELGLTVARISQLVRKGEQRTGSGLECLVPSLSPPIEEKTVLKFKT